MHITIARYLLHVTQDGDYLNDWLTHMPAQLADAMTIIGYIVAITTGA